MISKSSSALASTCSCCWYHPAQLKVRRKSVPTNWMFFCIFLLCICIHPFTMTKTKQTTMEKAAPKKAKKTAEEQIIQYLCSIQAIPFDLVLFDALDDQL